jgi:hypothetical protein
MTSNNNGTKKKKYIDFEGSKNLKKERNFVHHFYKV